MSNAGLTRLNLHELRKADGSVRWVVTWRADGSGHSQWFDTCRAATRFHGQLEASVVVRPDEKDAS